jgi:hypothetical protein
LAAFLLFIFLIPVIVVMVCGLIDVPQVLVNLLRRFVESDVRRSFVRAAVVAWLILAAITAWFFLPAALRAW